MTSQRYDYQAVPLPHSPFGETMYRRGRALTVELGLGIDELVWDCDELLWDWVLLAPRELLRLNQHARGQYGHHEWVRLKPGLWELIWGMHHAGLESGADPHLRISTNGYSWRLFRYAQAIPGFAQLVGPPAHPTEYEGWFEHPRVFCRADYVRAFETLLQAQESQTLDEIFGAMDTRAAAVIGEHLRDTPFSTSLKLPELAQIVGKTGFGRSRILLDDSWSNCHRFVLAGRSAVRAKVPGTHGKYEIPNTAWRKPWSYLDRVARDAATPIAEGLAKLAIDKRSHLYRALGTGPVPRNYRPLDFEVEIPSPRIVGEWVTPVQELKARWSKKVSS